MPCRLVLPLLILALASPFCSAAEPKKQKETPKLEGHLIVDDGGGLFSGEGIKKAKSILAEVKDKSTLQCTFLTFKELPEAKKKEFAKLDSAPEKERFFNAWTKEEAKDAGARGVVVLICRKPGHVHVLVDKQLHDKGFTHGDEEQVVKCLVEKFKEAKELPEDEQSAQRDKGLVNAAELIRDAYKKMMR